MGTWDQLNPPKMVDSSRFGQVLTITVLPQLNTLEQTDKSVKLTLMRQNLSKYF